MNLKYKILTFSLLMSGLGFTSCDDFLTQECRHAVVFKVADARDFHEKEADFSFSHTENL